VRELAKAEQADASFQLTLLHPVGAGCQAYFTAFLVIAGLRMPFNPGNPYISSRKQNGFATFGYPDFAACQEEVAARALSRVWYQKWLIHLTHRPESGGAVLHQLLSGNESRIDARLNRNVLNSAAPQQVFSKYGTYLLPQPFPEGSPTHPSYPHWSWNRCRRLHHLLVLLRRKLRDSQPPGADERWSCACPVYRSGCWADHRRGRTEQASAQRELRSRCSCWDHWRAETDDSMTLGGGRCD
jgi:hypothetical protein